MAALRLEARSLADGTVGGVVCDDAGREWDLARAVSRALPVAPRHPLGVTAPIDWLVASGHCRSDWLRGWMRQCPPAATPLGQGRLPPIQAPGKILALGRSFPGHARALGNDPPSEPLVFAKLPENMIGDGVAVRLPSPRVTQLACEVELAVVIGSAVDQATAQEAERGIAGYTILNDLTWRAGQTRARSRGEPWFEAKNLPRATPIGPGIVPSTEFDPDRAVLRCRLNGDVVMEGTMAGLMWPVFETIAWLSRRWPLHPGDIVSLGTPGKTPAAGAGDVVCAEIEGIGTLTTEIIGASE